MKFILLSLISLTLATHGATYWLLDKNVDGVGSKPKVLSVNNAVFGTDGSGGFIMTPISSLFADGSIPPAKITGIALTESNFGTSPNQFPRYVAAPIDDDHFLTTNNLGALGSTPRANYLDTATATTTYAPISTTVTLSGTQELSNKTFPATGFFLKDIDIDTPRPITGGDETLFYDGNAMARGDDNEGNVSKSRLLGLGTDVSTALGINIGTAGAILRNNDSGANLTAINAAKLTGNVAAARISGAVAGGTLPFSGTTGAFSGAVGGTRLGLGVAADATIPLKVSATSGVITSEYYQTGAQSASGGAGMVGYHDAGAAMTLGNRLGYLAFGGSAASGTLVRPTIISAFAEANWVNGSNYGAGISFETTANGGTTRSEKMRLSNAGNLSVTGAVTAGSTLAVTGASTFNADVTVTSAASTRVKIYSTAGSPNAGISLYEGASAKWSLASYSAGTFTFYNDALGAEAMGISPSTNAITFGSTTQSTNKDTGGAIFQGGVGIEKNANIGGTLGVAGDVAFAKTITAPATTGARTINQTSGRVNFAAAATSLVVTNSLCTANSIIHCTVATNDTTMRGALAVAGAGSFTIYADTAPTAETAVNFLLTN